MNENGPRDDSRAIQEGNERLEEAKAKVDAAAKIDSFEGFREMDKLLRAVDAISREAGSRQWEPSSQEAAERLKIQCMHVTLRLRDEMHGDVDAKYGVLLADAKAKLETATKSYDFAERLDLLRQLKAMDRSFRNDVAPEHWENQLAEFSRRAREAQEDPKVPDRDQRLSNAADVWAEALKVPAIMEFSNYQQGI